MLVEVTDIDTLNNDDHVDSMYAEMTGLTVNDTFTSAMSYAGANGEGNISLQFQAICKANYYGADCASYCIATDDSVSGHYTCNSDGSKSCLAGWTNLSTNCLTCT